MMQIFLKRAIGSILASVKDLLPIVLVILFFQVLILQQPLDNLVELLIGFFSVVIGLSLFIYGLNLGLFPIGEEMAHALTRKGSALWLILFAFSLGFGTTVAEPTLIAVADKAAEIAAAAKFIGSDEAALEGYSNGLRYTVALSVGIAVVLGVIRTIKGWPLQYFIIGGYVLVMIITMFAPKEIIGIAYDSGGVTTSTITVPLVTALGVGLASNIKGRNPMLDGFGLIALASLTPIIFVMIYGMLI